jgi:glutamate racemase
MWVPLIENNEYNSEGADYFIQQHVHNLLDKLPGMDTILLACTHYPLIKDKIRQYTPEGTKIIVQGEIVANSLADYLDRHPEIAAQLSKKAHKSFYTTDDVDDFNDHASVFYGEKVNAQHIEL